MSKNIKSLIFESEEKRSFWEQIANDPKALKDREKTREEALMLANYFEGKADGFCELLNLYGGPWRCFEKESSLSSKRKGFKKECQQEIFDTLVPIIKKYKHKCSRDEFWGFIETSITEIRLHLDD